MELFHVKQPHPFRKTAMASAYGAPLLGNSDGQQDGVLRLLALAVGLYARALHHGQSPGHGVEKQPHILNYKGWFFSGGLVCRMKQGFHLGLLLANRSIRNALKLQQQAAALQKENNTARYTALQNQLNPHFLFNSLNTLISEIRYNPANAELFTQHLSDVYRYTLQCQNQRLTTLREELDFLNSYVFLHRVRLGDCIYIDNRIPESCLEYQLPPLTIQLLAENVIKHNVIHMGKPMTIELIYMEMEKELVVRHKALYALSMLISFS